jgi:hypothetical protein
MGLSERMMTGQPLGAKLAAIASARTPAQSRNVTPARSRTSRSVRLSTARAAGPRNPSVGSVADGSVADGSVADGLDRQGMLTHGFSIGSRGLDDTK